MSDITPQTPDQTASTESSSVSQPIKSSNLSEIKDSSKQAWNQVMQLGMNLKLLLGGAILTFIATFFPAYGFAAPYYTTSFSNFSNLGWLSWLAALAIIILVLLPLFKVKVPMPWPTNLVYLIISIIGLVAAAIQLVSYLFDGTQWGGPQIGIFLVLVGTALMTYSSYNEQKIIPQPTQEQSPTPGQQ